MIARSKDITLQINETNRKWKRLGALFSKLKDQSPPVIKKLNNICNQIKKIMAALNSQSNDRDPTD